MARVAPLVPLRSLVPLAALLFAAACTVRGSGDDDAGVPSDVPRRGDARLPDAPTSFDCDPIDTGIFVVATEYTETGDFSRRTLSSYDPGTNTLTELADVGACVGSWYIRSMAVSRDGVVFLALANQTLAAYRIEDGTCESRMLPRSEDADGLYQLLSFVGDGSGSASVFHERLNTVFVPWSTPSRALLLDLDRTTLAEAERTSVALGDSSLVSLAGTEDGRLFATRFVVADGHHEVVRVDPMDGSLSVVATTGARSGAWYRTAVALWDSRVFVFDALDGGAAPMSTVSEANLDAETWSMPLLQRDGFEVQAIATTSCVNLVLF